MFRPPSLLTPQIVPTAAILPQSSRGFYVRAYRALLPPHAPDMLTVRTQAIDGTGTFTLSDSQPCRLLTLLHGHYPASALLRGSPPLSGASVLSASRLEPLVPCMGLCLSRSFGTLAHLYLSSVSLFDPKAVSCPDPRFGFNPKLKKAAHRFKSAPMNARFSPPPHSIFSL